LTVYQYWNRLSHAGFIDYLHNKLILGDSAETTAGDSTHCKVHQHACGAPNPENQALGRSRGGLNTKLHVVVDMLGRLAAKLILTGGNVSDHKVAPQLLETLADLEVIADKGYDSRKLRQQLLGQGCDPCIPAREGTRNPFPHDKELYKYRHVVENFFQQIKVFRRVATRYEKTSRMFLAFVIIAISAVYTAKGLWTPM
jgi:transposase